jgi:hypothetical protein
VAKKKAALSPLPPVSREELTEVLGGRVSVIHLQGPSGERDWLTMANKKTRLPKATIVRIALAEWGATKGLPPYPITGGED